MGQLEVKTCEIEGVNLITPRLFGDARGYFMETYSRRDLLEQAGIDLEFVQDNQSSSSRGVLRGLHFQKEHPQDKLVRVLKGEVFDVAVDLREGSSTFGKWFGAVLSDQNRSELFVPAGFAHGFLVLSDIAEFAYKCSDYYHPEDEGGIMWNDGDIGVEWPLDRLQGTDIMLSDRDRSHPSFAEYRRSRGI